MKRSLLSITFTFGLAAFALNACSSGGGGGSGSADNGPTVNAKQAYAWKLSANNAFLRPVVGTDGKDYFAVTEVSETGPKNIGVFTDKEFKQTSTVFNNIAGTATDFRFRLINKVLYLGYKDGGADKALQYRGRDANGNPQWKDATTSPDLDAVAVPPSVFYGPSKLSDNVSMAGTALQLPVNFVANSGNILGPQNSNPALVGSKVLMLGYMNYGNGDLPAFSEVTPGSEKLAPAVTIANDSSYANFKLQTLAYGNGTYLAGLQDRTNNKKVRLVKSTDLQKWQEVKSLDASGNDTLIIKAVVFQNQRFSILIDQSGTKAGKAFNHCLLSISYDLQFFDESSHAYQSCQMITDHDGGYRLFTSNDKNLFKDEPSGIFNLAVTIGTPK